MASPHYDPNHRPPRLNFLPPLNTMHMQHHQQPPVMYSPALPSGVQGNFPMPMTPGGQFGGHPLQTPMQQHFFTGPPGAPLRPGHQTRNSIAHFTPHASNASFMQTPSQKHYPRPSMSAAMGQHAPPFLGPPPAGTPGLGSHRHSPSLAGTNPMGPVPGGPGPAPAFNPRARPHKRQMSIGGPPKAVLGGPQAKKPASATEAIPLVVAAPLKKKIPVCLPNESVINDGAADEAEDGERINQSESAGEDEKKEASTRRPPWARHPLPMSAHAEYMAEQVAPPEIASRDYFPPDSWRKDLPDTIDVFLPTAECWQALKQQVIEAKLEKLGVSNRNTDMTASPSLAAGANGSNVPHIFAPHARVASISSPADPALLLFKLNKLQQSQIQGDDQQVIAGSMEASPQPPYVAFSPSSLSANAPTFNASAAIGGHHLGISPGLSPGLGPVSFGANLSPGAPVPGLPLSPGLGPRRSPLGRQVHGHTMSLAQPPTFMHPSASSNFNPFASTENSVEELGERSALSEGELCMRAEGEGEVNGVVGGHLGVSVSNEALTDPAPPNPLTEPPLNAVVDFARGIGMHIPEEEEPQEEPEVVGELNVEDFKPQGFSPVRRNLARARKSVDWRRSVDLRGTKVLDSEEEDEVPLAVLAARFSDDIDDGNAGDSEDNEDAEQEDECDEGDEPVVNVHRADLSNIVEEEEGHGTAMHSRRSSRHVAHLSAALSLRSVGGNVGAVHQDLAHSRSHSAYAEQHSRRASITFNAFEGTAEETDGDVASAVQEWTGSEAEHEDEYYQGETSDESLGEFSNPSDEERARRQRVERRTRRRVIRERVLQQHQQGQPLGDHLTYDALAHPHHQENSSVAQRRELEIEIVDQPRRLPNFPRPPDSAVTVNTNLLAQPEGLQYTLPTRRGRNEDEDDLISNPSEEEDNMRAHHSQHGSWNQQQLGPTWNPHSNSWTHQMPVVQVKPWTYQDDYRHSTHSRTTSRSGQWSVHDPAMAHSRGASEVDNNSPNPPFYVSTSLNPILQQHSENGSLNGSTSSANAKKESLNPFAKPFVFGKPIVPQVQPQMDPSPPVPSNEPSEQPGHARTSSGGKPLNVSAPAFKPTFNLAAPEFKPSWSFVSAQSTLSASTSAVTAATSNAPDANKTSVENATTLAGQPATSVPAAAEFTFRHPDAPAMPSAPIDVPNADNIGTHTPQFPHLDVDEVHESPAFRTQGREKRARLGSVSPVPDDDMDGDNADADTGADENQPPGSRARGESPGFEEGISIASFRFPPESPSLVPIPQRTEPLQALVLDKIRERSREHTASPSHGPFSFETFSNVARFPVAIRPPAPQPGSVNSEDASEDDFYVDSAANKVITADQERKEGLARELAREGEWRRAVERDLERSLEDMEETTKENIPPPDAILDISLNKSVNRSVLGEISGPAHSHNADDDEDQGQELSLPSLSITKTKRTPLPLEFKHPVSSNTVPAGLFKRLVSEHFLTKKDSNATLRSRINSREGATPVYEHVNRPSMDDSEVGMISGRLPPNPNGLMAVKPPTRVASDGLPRSLSRADPDDVFGAVSTAVRHERRRSSLPDTWRDDLSSASASRSCSPSFSPSVRPQDLTTRLEMQHIADVLAQTIEDKFTGLRRELVSITRETQEVVVNEVLHANNVNAEKMANLSMTMENRPALPASLSKSSEAMITEVVSLFRAQLHDSASKGFEDNHMAAGGEMDFQIIRELIEEGHREIVEIVRQELHHAVAQGRLQVDGRHGHEGHDNRLVMRDVVAPIVETVGERTTRTVVDAISDFANRQAVVEREILLNDILSALTPALNSLQQDPIDYDFLTSELTQAVKPHISQLIDLASDKRETAGLIIDHLLPRLPNTKAETEALAGHVISEVRKIVAAVDPFEIKEQVADLVVERLDSRLAVRDKAFNVEVVTTRVTDGVSALLEDLNRVPAAIQDLASKQKEVHVQQAQVASQQQEKILVSISELPVQIDAKFETLRTTQVEAAARVQQLIEAIPKAEDKTSTIIPVLEALIAENKTLVHHNNELLSQHHAFAQKVDNLPEIFKANIIDLHAGINELFTSRDVPQRDLDDLRKLNSEYQVHLTKARAAHGQARVEKDAMGEKLAVAEAEREKLRGRVAEMETAQKANKAQVEGLESRARDLEESLEKALARLQEADVVAASDKRRIAELEKDNKEAAAESQSLIAKVETLEMQVTFANRDKDVATQALESMKEQHEAFLTQQGHWENLRQASEKLDKLTELVNQADNDELKELRRYRDRTKTLEADFAALQKRAKDAETKAANSERTAAAAKQSLIQAQQRSSEWERNAKEYEAELENVKAQLDQSEQNEGQLEADYALLKIQFEDYEADDRLAKDREQRQRDQIMALEAKVVRLQDELLKSKTNRGGVQSRVTSMTSSHSPSPYRSIAATNGHNQTPISRPDSRASVSTVNGRDTSMSDSKMTATYPASTNGTPPQQSVWDSRHAPSSNEAPPRNGSSLHAPKSRYPYLGPSSTPKSRYSSQYARANAPSPSPSVVSAAPTQGEDGWWS